MRQLGKYFHYVLGVFTTHKDFRSNPVIGSRLLNLMGLHVFRVVSAAVAFRIRLWLLRGLVSPEERRQFRDQGFLLIPDFLPSATFHEFDREIRTHNAVRLDYIAGSSISQKVYLGEDALSSLPVCRSIVEDQRLLRLLRFASSKNTVPAFLLENVLQHVQDDDGHDPQKTFHSDTFHPSMKAWLYLDDVSPRNGCFRFYKGSQKLTWRRLVWEYRRSVNAFAVLDGHSEAGSFRVYEADRLALNLGEPEDFFVPANTLIIANTFGFHCRGDATERSSRLALWAYSRDTPFLPFPAPYAAWVRRIYKTAMDTQVSRLTAKAAKNKNQSDVCLSHGPLEKI